MWGYQLDIQVKPPKKKMEIELWFTGESKVSFGCRFEVHHQRNDY